MRTLSSSALRSFFWYHRPSTKATIPTRTRGAAATRIAHTSARISVASANPLHHIPIVSGNTRKTVTADGPFPVVSNIGDDVGRKTPVTDFRSMSKVSVGQILGLVEAVDEVGGVADAATISREVEMDVDRLGPILTAAEFLGLVTVQDGDIRITDLSRKLLTASVRERKRIVREIIDDLPTFRLVMDMARNAGSPLGRQEVVQALADRVGSHQAEDVFKALVYWGRYAELVRYDSESEQLTVRTAAM